MPQDHTYSGGATYADLEALPAHLTGEILFGELIAYPQPVLRHMKVAASIQSLLFPPYEIGRNGPGGWIFIHEPELHLGEHVCVPDLAGWRTTRLPHVLSEAYLELPPDWICEVSSRSTEKYDKGPKREIHAACGVPFLWQADHEARFIETFKLADGQWVVTKPIGETGTIDVAPFDAASVDAALIWQALGPANAESAADDDAIKNKT